MRRRSRIPDQPAAGALLKPRVFCLPNLRSRAGFPDMGLFIAARGQPLEDWPDARPPELGEPINRVLEVDVDGDVVTFELYDLPAAAS